MAKEEKIVHAKITCQFRLGQGMVYELKCDAIKISIALAAASGQPSEWNIEAISKHVPNAPTANAVGASRSLALSAMAQEWGSRGEAAGFPWVDWNAIREALAAVRAI